MQRYRSESACQKRRWKSIATRGLLSHLTLSDIYLLSRGYERHTSFKHNGFPVLWKFLWECRCEISQLEGGGQTSRTTHSPRSSPWLSRRQTAWEDGRGSKNLTVAGLFEGSPSPVTGTQPECDGEKWLNCRCWVVINEALVSHTCLLYCSLRYIMIWKLRKDVWRRRKGKSDRSCIVGLPLPLPHSISKYIWHPFKTFSYVLHQLYVSLMCSPQEGRSDGLYTWYPPPTHTKHLPSQSISII